MSNQVTTVEITDQNLPIAQVMSKMAEQFQMALPKHISTDKFIRTTMTAVNSNPDLVNADRRTLLAAATRAAQLGLLPDGREGAIVTFGRNCQFMPMIGGILKLARNSGEIASIDAQVVCKNDKFSYQPGVDDHPKHEPDWFGDRGDVIGVYAVARTKDGASYVEIMNRKQVDQVRNVSRAKDSGPWKTWWDEMARKTVLRRLSKRLPMSTDLDGIIHEDDQLFAPPEPKDVTPATTEPKQKGRASRLASVADQAPQTQAADADGVIEMEPGATVENENTGNDDSPI